MSGNTLCDHCLLQELQVNIEASDRVFHRVDNPAGILKVVVYSLRPGTDFDKMTTRERRQAHVAAFLEAPTKCTCRQSQPLSVVG